MPTLNFIAKYSKNSNLVISADEIRNLYLWGLPLEKNGQAITDEQIEFYIQSATEQLEEILCLKLKKQLIKEEKDFYADDWRVWGYIKATYPIKCAIELVGFLGTVKQVTYPRTWLSTRSTSDDKNFSRHLYLVPNTNSTHEQLVVYNGLLPNINYFSNPQIPNYWEMTYVTGFNKIPSSILNVLGKLISMNIFAFLSDALLPFPGTNSKSLSLDGLSQSLNFNGANGLFSARIKQYSDELFGNSNNQGEIKRLRDQYANIVWGVA